MGKDVLRELLESCALWCFFSNYEDPFGKVVLLMSSKCFVRIFLSSLNCGWVVVLLPASNFFLYIGSMVVLRGGSSHKLTGQT